MKYFLTWSLILIVGLLIASCSGEQATGEAGEVQSRENDSSKSDGQAAGGALKTAGDATEQGVNKTADALGTAGQATGNALNTAGDATKKGMQKATDATADSLKKAGEATQNALETAGKTVSESVKKPVEKKKENN